MAGPKSTRAFTLIELLVVIGIIGVLITLLMPTVSRAMVMAREYMTRSTIKELEVGIEAFKSDFKVYPTSKPRGAGTADDGRMAGERPTGAANLAYYLLGPGGSGWGIAGGGLMPVTNARPGRSYGPYYQADEDAMKYETVAGRSIVVGFLDSFNPPGVILYFVGWEADGRMSSQAEGRTYFYWLDGGTDPTGKKNYATLTYFEQCVKGEDATATTPYRRQDYFLVSPGQDGRYGAVMQNENTGEWEPTDLNAAGAYCDDIGNWKRTDER